MLRLQSALALRTRYNNKRIVLQREVEVVHGRTSLLLTHQPSRGFVAMIARGGAGVVAALGIVYIAYEAAIRLEMTQMRSIRKAIYKPQAELMSFNPGSLFLPRPDKTAFLAEVFSADPSGPILITGPQGSGKTAAIKQVLKGRFQTVYLDLRAQPVTTGEALTLAFVEQAGFLMPPRELVGRAVFAASATSSQTASFEIEKAFRLIREVLRADKASGLRGWISPGSNGQPVITPPLLCIDELNVSDVSALSEDPAFWRFIEWSLYITDNRLANVAISCSTEVAEMLDAHPGFRARRHRIFFDFPRAKSVASYFKNVVNTQLRDVCGAAPRPGGPMAKAISEAAAAKAKAAAIAAAEAAAASEQAAASARANINSDAANNEELNNGKSSSHSLTTTLWTFLFGSPNKTTADSSLNSSTKGDNMIDHLLSKKTASSTSEGRSVDSPASISATTVSAPQSSVISSAGTLSSLLSPAAITAAVTSSSTVLQGVQGSGQGSSPTLSTSASEPATDKLPSTPPTLTMVAQLEGEGPSAAFSFARAAALAAQTERDKSAAAAAVASSATVSSSASTLAAPVIAEAASVAIASTGAGPLPLPISPTEATNVISLQSSSSSQSKEVATLNTSSASSLTSNDGINVVTIPDYQQHPHITPQVVTMLSIKDLDTKNVSMTTKTTSSGSSGNNTKTAADATQSLVKESVSSMHLDVGGGTSLTSIDRSAILTATTQPSVTRPSNVTAAPHTSLNNHSSNVITTHEPSQTALSISSSLIAATTPTTAAASSSAVINPDRLNQSSLVNYFVYGSRYEFAPWGRTQSRYYLLEDHEIARIVETIGGNLKDLHTVVASIMSGKHWASALERLVADSADMVESTLDVLLAASTSDSTSSTSSASPGGGGAVSSATGGAAPGAVNLSVAGGGGGNRAGGGGRRGLRLRLLARAPLPQWDFAANPRPDRLAAYSRFLRAWDLMIELDRRKYVQRRELVDSIFAGCPHELEYLVDVGLAVAVNIKGMTRVANGGSSAQAQVAIEQFGLGKDGAVVTKVPGVYIAAASPRLRMAFRSLTRDALLVRHAARVRASVRLAHLRIEEARLSNKMMPDATAERSYWHGQVQQLLVRDTTLRSAVARELIALQAAAPVTAVDFLTKGTMTPEALKEGEGAPLSISEEISGTNLRGNDKTTHTTQTIVSGRDGGVETSPLLHLNSASSSAPLPPPSSPPPSPSPSSSTLRNWSFRDDPLNGVSEVPLLGASALSGQLEVALQSMREAENEVRSLRSRLTEIRTEIANEESKVRIMYEAVQLESSTLTKASSASSSSFVDRPDRDLAVSWVLDGGFVPTNGGAFPSSPVATSSNSAASVSSATPSSVSSANALNGDTHMTTISSTEGGLSTMSGKGVLNETSSSPVASSASSKLSLTSSSSLSSMSLSSPSSSNPSALSTTNSAISDDAPSTTPFTSASSGYYGSYQFLSEDKEEEEDDDDEEDSEEEEEAGGAAWAARRQNKQAARQQQKQERDSNITSSSSSTNPFGPTRRNFDRTEGEGSSSAIKPVKKQKTARTGSTKGAGEAQRKLGYSGWYRANDRDER